MYYDTYTYTYIYIYIYYLCGYSRGVELLILCAEVELVYSAPLCFACVSVYSTHSNSYDDLGVIWLGIHDLLMECGELSVAKLIVCML